MKRVRYNGGAADEVSAAGVKGVLLKGFHGGWHFRVYQPDGSFTDYEIRHDDLEVEISTEEMASFYSVEGRSFLDHSPAVLGLKDV